MNMESEPRHIKPAHEAATVYGDALIGVERDGGHSTQTVSVSANFCEYLIEVK